MLVVLMEGLAGGVNAWWRVLPEGSGCGGGCGDAGIGVGVGS
jgi:hypothetical protein